MPLYCRTVRAGQTQLEPFGWTSDRELFSGPVRAGRRTMDRTTENRTKSPVRTVVLDWTTAALCLVVSGNRKSAPVCSIRYIIANIHDIYETTTQEGAGGGLRRLGNIDIMRLPNRVMFWAVVLTVLGKHGYFSPCILTVVSPSFKFWQYWWTFASPHTLLHQENSRSLFLTLFELFSQNKWKARKVEPTYLRRSLYSFSTYFQLILVERLKKAGAPQFVQSQEKLDRTKKVEHKKK